MEKTKPRMQGPKTREQQKRTFERKDDIPREEGDGKIIDEPPSSKKPGMRTEKRQSKMAVSRHGMNQESQHHKPEPPQAG